MMSNLFESSSCHDRDASIPENSSKSDSNSDFLDVELDLGRKISKVNVTVEGLKKINPNCLKVDFSKLKTSQNIKELLLALNDIQKRFESYGVFSQSISELHRGSMRDNVNVNFKFKEKEIDYTLSTNINHKAETSIDFEAFYPNFFTNLNSLSISASVLGRKSVEFSARAFFPKLYFFDKYRGLLQISNFNNDMTKYASYRSEEKALMMKLISDSEKHLFSWGISMRNLFPHMKECSGASPSILNSETKSLKHSIKYVYNNDNLMGYPYPSEGYYTQAMMELCLPGGSVKYLKSELQGFIAHSFWKNLIFHGDFGIGCIFTPYEKYNFLQDLFHLGGAFGNNTVLRGFGYHGLGPVDKRFDIKRINSKHQGLNDFLGGLAYINSQMILSYPLLPSRTPPSLSASRVFGFLNLGNILDRFFEGNFKNMIYKTRMSIGVGVCIPLPIAGWIEIYAALPILYQKTDNINYFQAGLHLRSSQI